MTKTCLTMGMVFLGTICWATPFLTGAYLESGANDIGSVKPILMDGGYNTVKTSADLGGLQSILETFGSDIKTILVDRYWNPTTGNVGLHSLSYGNYFKLEAEYKLIYYDDLMPPDDTLFAFVVDDLTTNELKYLLGSSSCSRAGMTCLETSEYNSRGALMVDSFPCLFVWESEFSQ